MNRASAPAVLSFLNPGDISADTKCVHVPFWVYRYDENMIDTHIKPIQFVPAL